VNPNISAQALRRAADLRDQIEKLQSELNAILAGEEPRRARSASSAVVSKTATKAAKQTKGRGKGRTKRELSPEARARIVAAVKARWERQKGKAKS